MIRAFLVLVGLMFVGYGGVFIFIAKINHMPYHPEQLKLYASLILGVIFLGFVLWLHLLVKLSQSNDRRLDKIEQQFVRR